MEEVANSVQQRLAEVVADKDAKFGAKSKDKIWFRYKQHTSVDMQSGMINKVAITSANVIDSKEFKHIAPNQGAVYADKGYCDKNAIKIESIFIAYIKAFITIFRVSWLPRW